MDPQQNGNSPAQARAGFFVQPERMRDCLPGESPRQGYISDPQVGLTKREAFAMAAMQGVLGMTWTADMGWSPPDFRAVEVARSAVQYADALLAALAKEA